MVPTMVPGIASTVLSAMVSVMVPTMVPAMVPAIASTPLLASGAMSGMVLQEFGRAEQVMVPL